MKIFDKVVFASAVASLGIAAAIAAQAPAAPGGAQTPPQAPAAAAPNPGGPGGAGRGGRGPAYPPHPQADDATIARGQLLFSTTCSFCHGSDARGGEGGPNLVRSQLVMDDANGELIATVVQNGRPELGMPKFDLTAAQIADIAGYIHKVALNYRSVVSQPVDIVVGDAAAGLAFFNGPGKCGTCHSVTGDLAGIGSRMEAKSLQNALVSGGGGRGRGPAGGEPDALQTTVTVTTAGGKVYQGKLAHLDDFLVSLTETDGTRRSFVREGDVPKIAVKNPLQAHRDLLKVYTDEQIHNLTAYLVTVK